MLACSFSHQKAILHMIKYLKCLNCMGYTCEVAQGYKHTLLGVCHAFFMVYNNKSQKKQHIDKHSVCPQATTKGKNSHCKVASAAAYLNHHRILLNGFNVVFTNIWCYIFPIFQFTSLFNLFHFIKNIWEIDLTLVSQSKTGISKTWRKCKKLTAWTAHELKILSHSSPKTLHRTKVHTFIHSEQK